MQWPCSLCGDANLPTMISHSWFVHKVKSHVHLGPVLTNSPYDVPPCNDLLVACTHNLPLSNRRLIHVIVTGHWEYMPPRGVVCDHTFLNTSK